MNLQEARVDNPGINGLANRVTTVLLTIYLIVLTWILLFKLGVRFSYMGERKVNLIPFNELFILNGKMDVTETILNVLIFVPLGIYAGVLFQRWNFIKNLFFFFLVSLTIEGLQFILAIGGFDVTDIITNTSGGIIGFIMFKILVQTFDDRVKAQTAINVIGTIGTALMILLLILLKMDMLPIMYK